MKIKWGALIVDGRGKVGGHVAAKNRGGAYLRTKVTPTNPNSTAQATVRSRLGSLASGWRALTANQRAAWNAAVADFVKTDIFGDIKNPSGINLYTKLNANLLEIGEAQINVPPLATVVNAPTGLTLDISAGNGTLELNFAPAAIPAGVAWVVRSTKAGSAGISNYSGKFRNIVVLPAATNTGADVFSEYQEKFGNPLEDQKLAVEIVAVSTTTGQKSTAIVADAIVNA